MAVEYIIYCDESEDKGPFYSNFYGGALIKASDREKIEAALRLAQKGITGEAKWTKITEQDQHAYIAFALNFLGLIEAGQVKMRVMFTQNIYRTDHIQYEEQDLKFFKLYYQFIKHAFGLMYCNPEDTEIVHVAVYLDDAPDTTEALDNFKDCLASLTVLPEFFQARVTVDKEAIAEVNSKITPSLSASRRANTAAETFDGHTPIAIGASSHSKASWIIHGAKSTEDDAKKG
jgi:hypothetical protein